MARRRIETTGDGGGRPVGRRRRQAGEGEAASGGPGGGGRRGARWSPPLDPDPIGGEGGDFVAGECRWRGWVEAQWGKRGFFPPFLFFFISFLLFIPFGFIKLLIYFNFEECENNT